MRALLSMLLLSMFVAALPAGAVNSSFDEGIELRDVTRAGKMHFLAGFDSPFRYALSPERMRFAYSPVGSGSAPSNELRISDIRGRDAVVVHAPADIVDLAWAPAGRPIALTVASARGGDNGIWVVEPDGTGLRRVADYGYGLAWSPDSRELAMHYRQNGQRVDTIRILTVSTGAVRDIADGDFPSWSPDGKSIVYSWQDDYAHSPAEIRTVSADGGYAKTVTQGWAPTWSPDGKRIAFIRPSRRATSALWVVPSHGGYGRLLAQGAGSAMWLPNGRSLVFGVERSSSHCGYRTSLSLVPLRGGKPRRLLVSKSNVAPLAWNAGGNKLLYIRVACV